ncbi:MAG: hypothetical protein J6O62_00570 [Bacilli bacterium]|nr:hypothetical protein [Bacilli bacterium]
MKNNIKTVLIAILIGVVIGKYIFNQYEEEHIKNTSIENKNIYLMQYGVYKEKDNMIKNCKNLKNYFYYTDTDGYHVIVGITQDLKLKDKIKDSYDLKENIYMKKINIDNQEFLESLNQYDLLITNTTDKNLIITSEKQILSKYEELISNNEI